MARPVQKRDEIERAAVELFVAQGIAGTTTRQIAERAHAAEGTMYRYCRSKEDFAWEIYFGQLEGLMGRVRLAAGEETGLEGQLRAMVGVFFALFDRDVTMYSYLLLAEHTLAQRLPADFETPPGLLLRVLAEGKARGELAEGVDVHEAGALVMGAVARLATFHIYGRIGGRLSERVESLAALCWRAIGHTANQESKR